jgi:Family of unknown function (DUF6491)
MPRFRAMVLAVALPAVLLGGAADVPAADKAKKKRDCINTREINVMRALDDTHVFVKAGADRNYLLTMDPCPGLRDARKLQVFEASTRVCADGTSLLAFELPETGAMRCRVGKIESVRDLADAEDRIAPEHPRN